MATTTNYGWTTPDDTALVKDGASAIRTLGSSVDTTTKNLNPETTLGDIAYRSSTSNVNTRLGIGTTGQVLSVTGGVPAWTTPNAGDITGVTAGTGISGGGTSGDVTVTNSMATAIDAKGDLIVGTGADTFSRLAVGATNGHVLTVDSAEATGLKYASAASGGMTLLSTTSLTGASITVSSISQSYINLFLVVEDLYTANNETAVNFRFNADSNANRHTQGNATSSSSIVFNLNSIGWFYGVSNSASYKKMGTITIPNYTNATNQKFAQCNTTGFDAFNTANGTFNNFVGGYNQTSAISSFSLFPDSGNFSGGTVKVYGVK